MRAHVDHALPAPAGLPLSRGRDRRRVSEHDELLRQFLPRLRYDSNEQYFADSPAQWTDNPGHELRRGDGTLLARAPALSLGLLGETEYSDGRAVQPTDFIADPRRDYRAQYVTLRVARPELKNRIYGHAVERERPPLAPVLALVLLQRLLARRSTPACTRATGRWCSCGCTATRPTSRSTPSTSTPRSARGRRSSTTTAPDPARLRRPRLARLLLRGRLPHHRGLVRHRRRQAHAPPELTLEILDGDGPVGALAGRWGDTQPRLPGGLQQPSPTGPGAKAQWSRARQAARQRARRRSRARRPRPPR